MADQDNNVGGGAAQEGPTPDQKIAALRALKNSLLHDLSTTHKLYAETCAPCEAFANNKDTAGAQIVILTCGLSDAAQRSVIEAATQTGAIPILFKSPKSMRKYLTREQPWFHSPGKRVKILAYAPLVVRRLC